MNRRFVVLLSLALLVGAAITWIDTRPTWDDTGVSAGMIFVATALLGASMPSRAWVWALAVAVWIPLIGLAHGNHAAMLALLVGFVGAYAGAWVRRLGRRATP